MATMLQAIKKFFKASTGEESNQASVAGVFEELAAAILRTKVRLVEVIEGESIEGKNSCILNLSEIDPIITRIYVVWEAGVAVATSASINGYVADVNGVEHWAMYSTGLVNTSLKYGRSDIEVVHDFLKNSSTSPSIATNVSASETQLISTTNQDFSGTISSIRFSLSSGVFSQGSKIKVYIV